MPMTTAPPKIYTPSDIPSPQDMADYLSRVAMVRSCLLLVTPDLPQDMEHLTFQAANVIELALLKTERAVNAMGKSWISSGEIESGGF